jgi:hypothetical protein
VNVYERLTPQDRRVQIEGDGHLENLREMRRNRTRFGVLPPPPNERWTDPANLSSQALRDEAPLRQALVGASQGGSGTPHVSGVAAVARGVRPQVLLLWGFGRTPHLGLRDPAIARRLQPHRHPQALMCYLQQHEGRHDCQLPRGLRVGG